MVTQLAPATDLAIILVSAAIISIVARQTGRPTIVAYILTGLLLGPPVFGIVTAGEITATMGELGLAFLLFLLGIEMRIEDIRHIFYPIIRISLPQMALVCLAGLATALLLGFPIWVSGCGTETLRSVQAFQRLEAIPRTGKTFERPFGPVP